MASTTFPRLCRDLGYSYDASTIEAERTSMASLPSWLSKIARVYGPAGDGIRETIRQGLFRIQHDPERLRAMEVMLDRIPSSSGNPGSDAWARASAIRTHTDALLAFLRYA